MLTYRTNLLLSEQDHQMLVQVANKKGATMGEVIRAALKKVYKLSKQSTSLSATLTKIDKIARKVKTKDINYQELISYGRRF